jgi:hypothetical protein
MYPEASRTTAPAAIQNTSKTFFLDWSGRSQTVVFERLMLPASGFVLVR